jgi:hypothetical protein
VNIEKRSETARRRREERAEQLKGMKRVYRADELIAMGYIGSRSSLARAEKAGRFPGRRVSVGLQGVGYILDE